MILQTLIESKKYYCKTYIINGQNVLVKNLASDFKDGYIRSDIFRPSVQSNNYSITPMNHLTKEEYFSDIDFLVNELNGKTLDIQATWDAFYAICGKHINIFKRILSKDLETYLDQILNLTISLSEAFNMAPISLEDGISIRNDFRDSACIVFKDYLWIVTINNEIAKYDGYYPEKAKSGL